MDQGIKRTKPINDQSQLQKISLNVTPINHKTSNITFTGFRGNETIM